MPHFALSTIINIILASFVFVVAVALMFCRPISDRELLAKLRRVNLSRVHVKSLMGMIVNAWLLRRYTRSFPDADKEMLGMLSDLKKESTLVIRLAAWRLISHGLRLSRQRCCDSVEAYRRMIAAATFLNIEVAPGMVREFEDRALHMM